MTNNGKSNWNFISLIITQKKKIPNVHMKFEQNKIKTQISIIYFQKWKSFNCEIAKKKI
jgi:hypothetical protein